GVERGVDAALATCVGGAGLAPAGLGETALGRAGVDLGAIELGDGLARAERRCERRDRGEQEDPAHDQNRTSAPAPPPCGVTVGVGTIRVLCVARGGAVDADAAGGGGCAPAAGSSFVKKSTALVT